MVGNQRQMLYCTQALERLKMLGKTVNDNYYYLYGKEREKATREKKLLSLSDRVTENKNRIV